MKIFNPGETDYSTNGIARINPLKCIETKKKSLNGWYIEVVVSSKYAEFLLNDNIIVVETKEKGAQPFRIKNPEIDNGRISFIADHVVFDAGRYTVSDVRPTNLIGVNFLQYINERLDTQSPFTFDSDIPQKKTAYFVRKDLLTILEETEELFGGEYDIDGYHIDLRSSVSHMSDETLIYGKNIQGLKKYEDWSEVCTKILPEGPNGITLPEIYISADVQYEIPYTRNVSFSLQTQKEDGTEKNEKELIAELREAAQNYLDEHKFPKVNYTLTANINQNLAIGDIIPVKHPLATIETAVQEYQYDALQKRVTSIVYGNYERNVKKVFGNITNQIAEIEKKSSNFLSDAKNDVLYLLNSAGKNGSVVFRKNEKGVIYEILFLDTDSMETAKTVMRINNQGVAGSTSGVNGPFNTAVMANGEIIADMIKSGTLRSINIFGSNITGGTIKGDTIIEVGTDLKVGDNIYLGTDDPTERIKTITFANESFLKFYRFMMSMEVDGSRVSLNNGAATNTNAVGAAVSSNGVIVLEAYGDYKDIPACIHLSSGAGGEQRISIRTEGLLDIRAETTQTTIGGKTMPSGIIGIANGTITVLDGLIAEWDIPGKVNGYFYAQDGAKITVENGMITAIG